MRAMEGERAGAARERQSPQPPEGTTASFDRPRRGFRAFIKSGTSCFSR